MTPNHEEYELLTCYDWDQDPRPTPFNLMNELRDICAAATQELREVRLADFMAFTKRMRLGTLLHEDDEKDVFSVSGGNNEVWETKPFGEDDLARMYHGEPSNAMQVVLLLCHMKQILATKDETLAGQTAKIEEAIQRFDRGRLFDWGNRPADVMRRKQASLQ
jgi:hypothetical protein